MAAKSNDAATKSEHSLDLISDDAIDEYFKQVMPKLAAVVKASNSLPASEQYDFYSTYKDFTDVMQVEGNRALDVLSQILRHNGIRSATLSNANTDASDKLESLIDANDQLTERIGNRLDEAAGLKKPSEMAVQLVVSSTPDDKSKQAASTPITGASWNIKKDDKHKITPTSYRLLAARFVSRPQTKFKEKVDNSDKPFCPSLTFKPNAMISLQESLLLSHDTDSADTYLPNPYKYEIDRLEYADTQMEPALSSQLPKALSESGPLTYIDTVEALDRLCDDLKNVTELAVDLENHSYRSFQGLTCLMQLSTRQRDYIIDTLELRSDVHKLNPFFTDPKIVKVFHGADSDIEWLQRDFSIYVVNMFDTYQASKVLSFSRHSLAFLLKHYCNVEADKQYQLADWRIRPLPQELIDYAREDTHYLLYIYDQMKNTLIEKGNEQKNLLRSVLDKSRHVCSKVYIKPTLSEKQVQTLVTKSRKSFNNRQLYALRKLYEWRFRLAQEEDESMGYILPNHVMLQICEVLPRESSGVLACCNPIPPLVRQHLHSIHSLVLESREQPLNSSQTIRTEARIQADLIKTILSSPHDQSTDVGTGSRLPKYEQPLSKPREKKSSVWSFFTSSPKTKISEIVKNIKDSFTSPLANFNPVKFIDFTANFKTSNNQALKRSATDDTLNDSSIQDETLNPPPVKKSKPESPDTTEEAESVADDKVDTVNPDVEDGEISEPKKKKKKNKNKAKCNLPLRLRPASNPEKKLVQPAADFKVYDYSTADYSEFKPPAAPRPKKEKFDKKHKANKWQQSNEKSLTYRK